jgi:hypothetical protein
MSAAIFRKSRASDRVAVCFQEYKHESSSAQAVVARRGPRHRRVCGDAGRYSGIGGRHGSPDRKQCEHRIFECSQCNSVTCMNEQISRSRCHPRPSIRQRFCDTLGENPDSNATIRWAPIHPAHECVLKKGEHHRHMGTLRTSRTRQESCDL